MALVALMNSCGNWSKNLNIFPVEKDVELGYQVSNSFEEQNKKIILDSATNAFAYQYLYSVRDSILKNNELEYEKAFSWRIRIINDDTTLNAFCAPGGFIYFYTGILKYLESEDQLAGVMAHEMAHADKRHSTDAMTREFGAQLLLDLVFGQGKGQLARIATGVANLSYGREAEKESDEFSVRWLYNTSYTPVGGAGFFEKIEAQGSSNTPQFLLTHPNPENRIAKINAVETDENLTCNGTLTNNAAYAAFKASLP
jgi:predicted Zn-dependent protease